MALTDLPSSLFPRIDTLEALEKLCDGVVALLGANCEAVIHDFADLERSVVYVAGSVTNRTVGSPLTDLGVKTLISDNNDQDVLVYHATGPDGSPLKSVSVILREAQSRTPIGAVCFNFNIDTAEGTLRFLKDLTSVPDSHREEEHFPSDARTAIGQVMDEILISRGWLRVDLSREQAVEVVRDLDARGVFAYRSAPTIVGELLGLSRYTIYKYLKEIRS